MTEPDDFGLTPIQTIASVGDPTRSVRHAAFWKTWSSAVFARSPRLVPREDRDSDPSDPGATHEFESFRGVRIGCRIVRPAGRPTAGLVALHGYSGVPTLEQSAQDWSPLTERGVAVLIVRIRGYPGSRADVPHLVEHAQAPDGGGGRWITHGLEIPASEHGCGTEWSFGLAASDVVNACRALRAYLGFSRRAPVFMHGESLGAALAIIAAGQLHDADAISRLAIGLPSMGDWPWRLSRPTGERGPGAGSLIREFVTDHRALEGGIVTTLRIFDAALHARQVLCPTLCKLAFSDDVVPAPTAATVFNNLGTSPGLKWRFVTRYGHFDGGIADTRRHALFDRLCMQFLDPAVDPLAHDWERAEAKPQRHEPRPAVDGQGTFFGAEPLPGRDPDEELIAAYVSTGRTLDDLPYTAEFDRLYRSAAAGTPNRSERDVLHKLHNLRKAGRLPRLGKPATKPPRIDETAECTLAELVIDAVGSLGQRDRLPYTEQFAALVAAFNQRTGSNLDPHDVWRLVAKLAK